MQVSICQIVWERDRHLSGSRQASYIWVNYWQVSWWFGVCRYLVELLPDGYHFDMHLFQKMYSCALDTVKAGVCVGRMMIWTDLLTRN